MTAGITTATTWIAATLPPYAVPAPGIAVASEALTTGGDWTPLGSGELLHVWRTSASTPRRRNRRSRHRAVRSARDTTPVGPMPETPRDEIRSAQQALLRGLTPGQRIERLADLCRQLAELRRAGAQRR